MSIRRLACIAFALLVPGAAFATVSYPDVMGETVVFTNMSETTTSPGDSEPLFMTPMTTFGDTLSFSPPGFGSSSNGGSSDVTSTNLSITLDSGSTSSINTVSFFVSGDTTLLAFPPSGTPTTNAGASFSGTLTVTETFGGAIAPVVIPFTGTIVPSDAFALPGDFGNNSWTGSALIDVLSAVPNATEAELSLDHVLTTMTEPGGTAATIQSKSALLSVETQPIPEPSSALCFAAGVLVVGRVLRRRSA